MNRRSRVPFVDGLIYSVKMFFKRTNCVVSRIKENFARIGTGLFFNDCRQFCWSLIMLFVQTTFNDIATTEKAPCRLNRWLNWIDFYVKIMNSGKWKAKSTKAANKGQDRDKELRLQYLYPIERARFRPFGNHFIFGLQIANIENI